MIRKEIIDYLAEKTNVKQRELIEKDVILHRLLFELLLNRKFDSEYAFKGGTCLMKCHLGYYRFSEDLDFTWLNTKILKNKSEKQIRKLLSIEINYLASLLEKISKKLNLDFKADKRNKKYFDFGGSNAYATFKLWDNNEFIKIQVNYREVLFYPVRKKTANTMIDKDIKKEFSLIFPEESEFLLKDINLYVYDLKEILVEKIRAILTRKGVKARDFIDVYMIGKDKKLKFEKFEFEIISKVENAMKFEKYRVNFKDKLESKPIISLGSEEYLLLRPIGEDFHEFLERMNKFIEKILKKLSETDKG